MILGSTLAPVKSSSYNSLCQALTCSLGVGQFLVRFQARRMGFQGKIRSTPPCSPLYYPTSLTTCRTPGPRSDLDSINAFGALLKDRRVRELVLILYPDALAEYEVGRAFEFTSLVMEKVGLDSS